MRAILLTAAISLGLGACGYVSEYERQVYDLEPVYCYRTLGKVECYREPDRTRDRVMVNYYGPHPSRTDPPEKPDYAQPGPPPEIDYWVKDPEPRPEPSAEPGVAPAAQDQTEPPAGESHSFNTVIGTLVRTI